MSLLTVETEKCKKDGICAAACPVRIIKTGTDGIPSHADEADKLCIGCGHCVSVCPSGALSLNTIDMSDCMPLTQGWRIKPDDFEKFAKGRRSIRNYKSDTIERTIISRMIDIADHAPTGHNSRPIQWLVIQGKDEVNKIAGEIIILMRDAIAKKLPMAEALGMPALVAAWEHGEDLVCRGAPALIIAHAPKDNPYAAISAANAIAYLELAAVSFGAGTCWAGFLYVASTMSSRINNVIGLPENHKCFGGIMAGYPKFEYKRIPNRGKSPIVWR